MKTLINRPRATDKVLDPSSYYRTYRPGGAAPIASRRWLRRHGGEQVPPEDAAEAGKAGAVSGEEAAMSEEGSGAVTLTLTEEEAKTLHTAVVLYGSDIERRIGGIPSRAGLETDDARPWLALMERLRAAGLEWDDDGELVERLRSVIEEVDRNRAEDNEPLP